MKFISITKSINIRPDWATIGARLKAGTPLDITGAVANSSAAVGILADDAEKSSAEVAVVTEGSIDLAEITASYGELEDDCIAAIKGISFIDADGNPIVPSGGGLPDYSTADSGSVLTLYGPYPNCVPAWLPPQSGGAIVLTVNSSTGKFSETWQTIYDALGNGTRVVYVSQNNSEGYVERQVFDIKFAYGGGSEYGIEGEDNLIATCTSADAYPVPQQA